MKFFNATLAFLLFLCFSQPSYSDTFSGSTSRWPAVQTKAIALSDTYAFVGDGDTINIYTKDTMEMVSYLRLDNISEGILALIYDPDHDSLYAACGYSGVQVIDVSNITYPILSKSYLTSNQPSEDSRVVAYDIDLHGNFLFIADVNYCLRIINIDPATILEVAVLDLSDNSRETPLVPFFVGVYSTGILENVYAILIARTSYGPFICRFQVLGLDDGEPEFVSVNAANLPSLAMISSFQVKGDYAYCLDGYLGDLYIYDISHDNLDVDDKDEDGDKTEDLSPELKFAQAKDEDYDGNYLGLFNPRALFVNDTILYVTTHGYFNPDDEYQDYYGINSIDIEDLTKPEPIDRVRVTGANSLVVEDDPSIADELDNDIFYFTTTWSGFNRSDSTSGQIPAETMINAYDVSVEKETGIIYSCDNRATTATEEHGVTIIRVKSETVTETDAETGEKLVTVVREAAPGMPVKETFLPTPGTAKASCFDPTLEFAYVADGTGGIQVLDLDGGPGSPVIIPGSNIPAPASGATTYEVIDVSETELTSAIKYLMAITTDPNGELMIIDVSEGTSLDSPVVYEPRIIDLDGETEPKRVIAYEYNDGLYAIVAQGTAGVTFIRLNPNTDFEDPYEIVLPPEEDQIIHMDFDNALSIFASSNEYDTSDKNNTGIYAYVANGAGGVAILELYDTEGLDLVNMKPSIIQTIDIKNEIVQANDFDPDTFNINAIDVHVYQDTVTRMLYILTDDPYYAVMIYDIQDFENPVYKGSSSTFGQSNSLWATELQIASESSTTGFVLIRGVFVADGHGGVTFRQVTDESTEVERRWKNDNTTWCFISSSSASTTDRLDFILIFGLIVFVFAGLGILTLKNRCLSE